MIILNTIPLFLSSFNYLVSIFLLGFFAMLLKGVLK